MHLFALFILCVCVCLMCKASFLIGFLPYTQWNWMSLYCKTLFNSFFFFFFVFFSLCRVFLHPFTIVFICICGLLCKAFAPSIHFMSCCIIASIFEVNEKVKLLFAILYFFHRDCTRNEMCTFIYFKKYCVRLVQSCFQRIWRKIFNFTIFRIPDFSLLLSYWGLVSTNLISW